MFRPTLEHSSGKWRSFFLCSHWCPVYSVWLGAARLCKCSRPTPGCCRLSYWDAAAKWPRAKAGISPAAQGGQQGMNYLPMGTKPLDPNVPLAWGSLPTQLSGMVGTASSLPSLPLGFRCTNPRGRTLPLQPVRATSPPPPPRWALPAVRTPLKRRRPPFRVTPATTLDCPPILTSGTCEGSCCRAADWTKCVGNEGKTTAQDKTKPTAARSHGNGVSTPMTA